MKKVVENNSDKSCDNSDESSSSQFLAMNLILV